jgi:hypothetical protein
MADLPALEALEAQLEERARSGDYAFVVDFLRDSATYAHVQDCCLQRVACNELARACERRPGEAEEATRGRAAAVVAADALGLAVAVIQAHLGACSSAVRAACRLMTALTRCDTISEETLRCCAELDAPKTLMTVLQFDDAEYDSQPEQGATVRRAAYDALLGVAGAPHDGRPHTQAEAAAALPVEHRLAVHRYVMLQTELPVLAVRHTVWAAQLHLQHGPRSEPAEDLCELMRSAGRVFRWAVSCTWLQSDRHVFAAALHAAHESLSGLMQCQAPPSLLRWGVVYVFLPHVSRDRLRKECMPHLTLYWCRARCCIDLRRSLELDGFYNFDASLEMCAVALQAHRSCVRAAARLIAWAALGCPRVQQVCTSKNIPALLRGSAGPPARRGQQRRVPAAVAADDDQEEAGDSDGEALSEWGDGDAQADAEADATSASTAALVARALRAIAGEDSASAAQRAEATAAAAAAADAAAAALLAELEGESKSAAATKSQSQSKSKKKGKKKQGPATKPKAAASAAAAASDESDGDVDVAAAGDDDDVARLAGMRRGAGGPASKQQVPPMPPPPLPLAAAPAVAAAPPPLPKPQAAKPLPVPHAAPRPRRPPLPPFASVGCACGDAACRQPPAHAVAPPQRADDVALEALFPWLLVREQPGAPQTDDVPAAPAAARPAAPIVDAPHEDDDLCVICLDAPRDTPLAGCGAAHPPALCAGCARRLLAPGGAPVCPLCRAPAVPL